MIQHHLVYHYTSLDDGVTYYEANSQSAYYLVRSGKIVHLVQDRLGKYAAKVMSALLFLGHAPISYLETLPELRSSKPMANGVNHDEEAPDGRNGEHYERPPLLHSTLKALASHGYIMRVREAHLQSPADNWLDAERAVSSRPDIKSLKGKKQQEAILQETSDLVAERTDGDLTRGLMFNGLPRGIKRKSGHGSGTSNKRARIDNGMVNGDSSEKEEEENDWSEDEDEYDTTPMDVGYFSCSMNHRVLTPSSVWNSCPGQLLKAGCGAPQCSICRARCERCVYRDGRGIWMSSPPYRISNIPLPGLG
jgi:DNA-directed RNA polymerase III subunit RPC3